MSVGKGFCACRDQEWGKSAGFWCLGRNEGQGGTLLRAGAGGGCAGLEMTPEHHRGAVMGLLEPRQLWEGRETPAQGEEQRVGSCSAFFSGTRSASEGRSGAKKDKIHGVRRDSQSWAQAPSYKHSRASSPFLLPASSVDKWGQIAFWKVFLRSRGSQSPTSRWISAACLCFLTARLNLMSHLKC